MSSNLELGKFFADEYGVRIPLYIGVSEQISNPQYNPLDPDILFKTTLSSLDNKAARDSFRFVSQDYVSRKSINLTNIRKTKVQKKGEEIKKPKIYDLENFTISYSNNETFFRNINTEYNRTKNYRGAITYNYSSRPKNIKPFSKLKIG